MDKRKSILNVSVSMAFKIVTVIMSIVVKRFLIRYCGNEVNGLNALYLSVIGFLSVVELGVGSAITFCMYRPIVEKNQQQVSALYHLFRKIYLIVAGIIFAAGLMMTPFIKNFARDYSQLDVNLYSTFILMLISVVITYLYSAKTSLINAYANNYITTAITSGGIVIQYILQIVVLIFFGSFEGYLTCRIAAAVLQWIVTDVVTKNKYAPILADRQKVDEDTKYELTRSIKAMFMHKVGTLLVNTVDSIVISVFVGVVTLGKYSNYDMISVSMSGIIGLVFTSLVSVVGHLYAEKNKEHALKVCEAFHILNFAIGIVFFLGYYAIADNLVSILFGKELVIERSVLFVITLNGFIQFMRKNVLMFRDATGTFYNDRWKPLIEGIVNVILSVWLVKQMGVAGVIAATIITNLLICHVIEPYVLYQNAFRKSPGKYYLRNYGMIILFAAAMMLMELVKVPLEHQWQQLLANGSISLLISGLICCAVLLVNREICGALMAKLRKVRKT